MNFLSIIMQEVYGFHDLKHDQFDLKQPWDECLCLVIIKEIGERELHRFRHKCQCGLILKWKLNELQDVWMLHFCKHLSILLQEIRDFLNILLTLLQLFLVKEEDRAR